MKMMKWKMCMTQLKKFFRKMEEVTQTASYWETGIALILSIPRARGQQYSFYIWGKKPSRTQSKSMLYISLVSITLHVSASF
jgi:hypothetical protein